MITEYPLEPHKTLEECTTEDLQKAYEQGYEAVLNDGKLRGFKKAPEVAASEA